MEKFRFHVVGLPHTVVSREFSPCAYTGKVLRFCDMMKSLGHEVFLYAGGDTTEAKCDEFISCISLAEQDKYFGATDWHKDMFPITWEGNEPYWIEMNTNAIAEIKKRGKLKDFVCLIGGSCQMPIIQELNGKGYICMEFGVGYKGIVAPFRVFESNAWKNHVYGLQKIENGQSFDTVIPNYFDIEDFPFREKEEKEDYFLYIGRMITRKGANIAVEATGKKGAKLKMAGQGILKVEGNHYTTQEFDFYGDHIEYVGTVGVKERFELMSKAKAVFVLTNYIGPFEGVHIEAALCGTPCITSDNGVFTETITNGFNGYRTKTMGEVLWAMDNVDQLNRKDIREWAVRNFSLDRVKYMYHYYFEQLYTLWGEGWKSDWCNGIANNYYPDYSPTKYENSIK